MMKHKLIVTIALVFTTTSLTFATGSISIPHVFSPGQAAKASDVNENFQALADAINQANLRFDPFSRPDDFVTTVAAGLTVGNSYSIAGASHTLSALVGISMKDGDASSFNVKYPEAASGSYGFATIRNQPLRDMANSFSSKTSVDGYPVVITPYMRSDGDASVELSIQLDEGTFLNLDGYTYPGATSSPMTKAEQQAVIEYYKALPKYISIQKSSS